MHDRTTQAVSDHSRASLSDADASTPPAASSVKIVAAYLGERIEPKILAARFPDRLPGRDPILVRYADVGWIALFSEGVIVFFDVPAAERQTVLDDLGPDVVRPFDSVEAETATLLLRSAGDEHVERDGEIILRALEPGRIRVVAAVLAKSTALAHYEREVGAIFAQIEPLTRRLREGKGSRKGHRRLIAQLGGTLLTQARVMGSHEVVEKPDVTWDAPELDRLYALLASEYELADRARILSGKADFVSRSIQLLIDMDRHRQSTRLEWYIVILIMVEIVLLVWEMLFRG